LTFENEYEIRSYNNIKSPEGLSETTRQNPKLTFENEYEIRS